MLKHSAISLATLAFLSGCATGPSTVCLPNTAVQIANSDVPTVINADKKYIVLPVDINFNESAKSKIKTAVVNQLESQMSKSGVNLVDRKLAIKLKNEILLAEQSGRYNSSGIAIADYAVITEVTKNEFSKSFNETRYYENKDGETKRIPANCDYRVEFAAVAKVVSLPDMTLIKRIELYGSDTHNSETSNSKCPLSQQQYDGMSVAAAIESVDHTAELKELLAPSAPVLELRKCEEGIMAKVGFGLKNNIAPDTEIAFSTSMKNDQGEIETFPVGEGEVVDIPQHGIKDHYAWVTVDEKTAAMLKKGDEAKVVPKICPMLDPKCWAQQAGIKL